MAAGLSSNYAIVGVGETPYIRGAGRSTRALGVEAVRQAILDAGLDRHRIDGMLSYSSGDSTTSPAIATDLGIRLNFYMDCLGGGSSTEALVGIAMGVIEMGMCHTVAIFRAMNGYSGVRRGGIGSKASAPVAGADLFTRPYGLSSAAHRFGLTFTRHMYEFGTTSEQAAQVKVVQSHHASSNPKALMKNRVTVEDVLRSRWIAKPLHLLDCCLETDNATAIVVTSIDRARDLRHSPVRILGAAGRVSKPRADFDWQSGLVTEVAGYSAKEMAFGMAGIGPEDVDITGAYDAFSFTTLMQLEAFGFCKKGEGGDYVASKTIELGNRRPNNTSGGQLCEGYTHGMNLVIENVRQLRHQADDYCADWRKGVHSYDYKEGGCRQVRGPKISMNLGWASPGTASALILTNE